MTIKISKHQETAFCLVLLTGLSVLTGSQVAKTMGRIDKPLRKKNALSSLWHLSSLPPAVPAFIQMLYIFHLGHCSCFHTSCHGPSQCNPAVRMISPEQTLTTWLPPQIPWPPAGSWGKLMLTKGTLKPSPTWPRPTPFSLHSGLELCKHTRLFSLPLH